MQQEKTKLRKTLKRVAGKAVTMKKLFLLSFIILTGSHVFGQRVGRLQTPSAFFPAERARVLVVGSFHFDYPNLDVQKTGDENKIDVLKDPKKSEVTELVNYIKKFKPTKIALEALPGWKASEKLRSYKAGAYRDKRDERYQLGMRIAIESQLDTIYSIDAASLDEELSKRDSTYIAALFQDFDFKSADQYSKNTTKRILPTSINCPQLPIC